MQQDPCISNVHESIQCWPGAAELGNLSCTCFHAPEMLQSMLAKDKSNMTWPFVQQFSQRTWFITLHSQAAYIVLYFCARILGHLACQGLKIAGSQRRPNKCHMTANEPLMVHTRVARITGYISPTLDCEGGPSFSEWLPFPHRRTVSWHGGKNK
ncbi:hypothetical protein EDB85DRAFT_431414 [Lactarius pseudohatsudake]|nr:hypothetical protein EDB85DRAFT_431414 [Lactarius pseudohatsudake]